MSKPSILIVDDELASAKELALGLEGAGYAVSIAQGSRLKRALRTEPFDVVLSDQRTADVPALLELVGEDDAPAVILLAAFGSVHDAVLAMQQGAFDYIEKPATEEQILVAVARAVERRSLAAENRRLRAHLAERFDLGRIQSKDPAMQRVLATVAAVCDTRATILIEGESGTGKTMLARTIHQASDRAAGPFVEVSCGALPASLLESELFGHVRGAFTGAVRDKPGKFEAAGGGTLFLDEISSAPLDLQVKLLRVLQDKAFERVGDTRTRTADVRILVASNQDLAEEVRAGRFREDLYYRVRVVSVTLPPLRERPGDVPLLAEAFVARFRAEHGRPAERLSPACLPILAAHDWPGNVRELEHVIERAVLLAPASEVRPEDLGPELAPPADAPAVPEAAASPRGAQGTLRQALEDSEREIVLRALMMNRGNRNATAAMLGINRTTLFNKMRKHGLMDARFHPIR